MKPVSIAVVLALTAGSSTRADDPARVFEERILPIFKSENPSSCVECHLSGVDLKHYILPSSRDTFLSLRDQGLVDLESPKDSKILRLIGMRPEKGSGASLIHEDRRRAERDAFAAWIASCATDEDLRGAPPLDASELARPERADAIIRHNRIDGVVDSFRRTIWALRFRCSGCHMPGGLKFDKHREEHGEKMGWLRAEGPAASMRRVVERELVDLERPERSKLLLKPLNEIEHGGGVKMFRGDTDYMAFLGWIRDYAAVSRDGYAAAAELPSRSRWTGSEIWLRIENVPEAWLGRYGVLAVHARDGDADRWSAEPVAVTSFLVRRNPRFGVFAQGYLMLRSKGVGHVALPPGEYDIRIHLGGEEPAGTHFDAAIAAAREVGRATAHARWEAGFRKATAVDGAALRLRRAEHF